MGVKSNPVGMRLFLNLNHDSERGFQIAKIEIILEGSLTIHDQKGRLGLERKSSRVPYTSVEFECVGTVH